MSLTEFRKKIAKFMEKYLIKKCDLILAVSENIANLRKNKYKLKIALTKYKKGAKL